jgi:hypothetical protein
MTNETQKAMVHDYLEHKVEEWHSTIADLPLHEWLDMTKTEYNDWLIDPNQVPERIVEKAQQYMLTRKTGSEYK